MQCTLTLLEVPHGAGRHNSAMRSDAILPDAKCIVVAACAALCACVMVTGGGGGDQTRVTHRRRLCVSAQGLETQPPDAVFTLMEAGY